MDRLEHHHHIQTFYSPENNCTTIELPRMALQFEIDSNGQLHSREYPGMKVKNIQKFGTFVGLQQGLLLESVDSSVKSFHVLLVPHGNIKIESGSPHQVVKIGLETLRKPEFLAFEVDERLRQLRAGQSHTGWLFLALLHGATACPIEDPFTGLTGTESAFQLLQSAHCWSCQPLDKEANETLKAIAGLSPCRMYYPSHLKSMETVHWPDGLSSLAAHDGYQIIVKKLIEESQRLAFLHKKSESNSISYCNVLVQKSYWQHIRSYTEQARVSPELIPTLQAFPQPVPATNFDTKLDDDNMKCVRVMANLGNTWSATLPKPVSCNYLKTLLISGNETLSGVNGTEFYPSDLTVALSLNFEEKWLDLYNFARSVHANHFECDWIVMLCTLAFTGTPLLHLQILHAVAVNPKQFHYVDPPPYSEYSEVSKNDFDFICVKEIFLQNTCTLSEYIARTDQERRLKEDESEFEKRKTVLEAKHSCLVASQVAQLTNAVEVEWPTRCINSSLLSKLQCSEINLDNAIISLNSNLRIWYMNRELNIFLEKVETMAFKLSVSKDVCKLVLKPSLTVPSEGCKQYELFHINLCSLLKTTGCDKKRIAKNLPSDNRLTARNKIATDAENIFRTGQTDDCNLLDIEVQSACSSVDICSFPWDIDNNCEIGNAYMTDNSKSWEAYRRQPNIKVNANLQRLARQLEKAYKNYFVYAKDTWKEATKRALDLNQTFSMQVLMAAGLFPRLLPATLLPLICNKELDEQLRNFLGATAVIWTLEQQANRCLKFAKAGNSMEVTLKKEMETMSQQPNWSPKVKPEWLLLELDMDLKIRPIQIKVAESMLSPDDGRHALMQLNMGEGKTSVIIPLIIAVLANEKQLCRVTVLKALFHMNREALMFKMGGLLNRRIYIFPCRRDVFIGCNEASTIQEMYEECIVKRGIVLALPEHRLSFLLKGYEHSHNGKVKHARALLKLQEWLKENTRDVLDESDAILHVKYQLIYTFGQQKPLDGSNLRWIVAQSLLKLVPTRLSQLTRKYGGSTAECSKTADNPEQFPPCRLLKTDCYEEFCEMLAADILDGKLEVEFPDIQAGDRVLVSKFLYLPVIGKDDFDKASQIFDSDISTRNHDVLLILRGLLACGILSLVLCKRWRVDYGVNPNGNRLMAVPFRAKDVAADRTEFGHPDVGILSTILSYYYSGLNNNQLDQCFELLYRQQNSEQEYAHWISKVKTINPSIKILNGVNLADYCQRVNDLNPALLKNMAVIDFWLDKVVFRKECKQFGCKILCSPWDLCADDTTHPVTGFSGTNDTKLLLPKNISQNDLPELLGTNGKVLYNLLLPENEKYACLPHGTSNLGILKQLTRENIPLLLDVGALMTEYSNRDVASKWLNLPHKTKKTAAIYFDKDDKLVVIDKRGRPCLFELSPYRKRMEECLIYLDDFHTRGTDLKISLGTKGCVTLGKGVTKDKLVQGCMRMRMLGEGHTVCFWASREVNGEILKMTGKEEWDINSKDVLTWAMENSRLVTRDGFLHWVTAGVNYATKKMAHCLYDLSRQSNADVRNLGEQCSIKEISQLQTMYGQLRQEELFTTIPRSALQFQVSRFKELNVGLDQSSVYMYAKNLFFTVGIQIVEHCNTFVPSYKRISHMFDEEQERELEHELEEERDVLRPPPAKQSESLLAEEVKNFVRDGTFTSSCSDDWFVKLPFALRQTNLWPHAQAECWGENIYATKDFVCVIKMKNQNQCIDQFLRPPTWVAILRSENQTVFLLLSPYEVNELIPVFRSGTAAAVLHMYAARLRSDQDTLLQCPELAIPSSTTPLLSRDFSALNANLSLFSGNMYFANEEEQNSYVCFLGFIPRPRTDEEQQIFDNGWTINGFVRPKYRQHLQHVTSQFKKNPNPLVQGIIDCRYDYFPNQCHVARVIVALRKPLPEDLRNT